MKREVAEARGPRRTDACCVSILNGDCRCAGASSTCEQMLAASILNGDSDSTSANRCLLRIGKKSDASDSVSESVKREVAEARGPRRTDACCVSILNGDWDARCVFDLGEQMLAA